MCTQFLKPWITKWVIPSVTNGLGYDAAAADVMINRWVGCHLNPSISLQLPMQPAHQVIA